MRQIHFGPTSLEGRMIRIAVTAAAFA